MSDKNVDQFVDEQGTTVKIIHARYRYNTHKFDDKGNPIYNVIYLENNATDVMIDGYTPYTEEELANVPDIDPESDRLMEALKKVDGKIKRIKFGDPNDPNALFKIGDTMVAPGNKIDRKLKMLNSLAEYEALGGKYEKGMTYMWEDDGIVHYQPLDIHNQDTTAHKDIRDALKALAGGVASVERAMLAGRLDPGAKINGVLFDGTKDITINIDTSKLVAYDAERLGGIDADLYALKSEVYTRSQLYTRSEVYTKIEIDNMSGVIPGGKIYIQ